MRTHAWFILPVGVMLLLTVFLSIPAASATTKGTGTSCSGFGDCKFTITNSKGTGWAQTYGNSMSFQLPGESNASTGLAYSYFPNPIYGGTYTITGSFLGTDVNTGKVVYGSTVTNITVTVHCQRGCTTTWALNSGNITFHPTKAQPTKTSFTCSPTSINSGGKTKCRVTVTDLTNSSRTPSGTVKFSTQYSGLGKWAPSASCTLASGSCQVNWTAGDETVGGVALYAQYKGTTLFYTSTATTDIYVTSPP